MRAPLQSLLRAALLALLLAQPRILPAAALPEAEVKAAFIFNFLLFTNWEGRARPAPIQLCLLGEDAVAQALRQLDGHRLGRGQVLVRGKRDARSIAGCHALYLAPAELRRDADALGARQARGILSVSDGGERLAADGSMLVVAVQQDRVVFGLDLKLARSQGLNFDARALALAGERRRP